MFPFNHLELMPVSGPTSQRIKTTPFVEGDTFLTLAIHVQAELYLIRAGSKTDHLHEMFVE